MSQINKDKVSLAGFAGLASTETLNIFELGDRKSTRLNSSH